jgi:hypothetical protein
MDEHFDTIRVAGANIAAIMLSFSGVEEFFRIAGLAAAAFYTCLKCAHLIKHWNRRPMSKKEKEDNGS